MILARCAALAALLLAVAPPCQAQLTLDSVNDGGRPENYARRVLASPDGIAQCIPGDQCMGCTWTPQQGSFIPIDYTYCLPSLMTTCDYYENTYQSSCKLWELIQPQACVAPGCDFVADGDYVFFQDLKPVHWLTLPTRPVRGMENWEQLPGDPNAIWDITWGIVSQGEYPEGYNQSQAVPPAQAAFMINPTDQRTQHQLHLHSLVMPAALRDLLQPARDQQGGTEGWYRVSTTCNGTAVNLDVRYSSFTALPSATFPFESLVEHVTTEAAPGTDAPQAAWWHFGLTLVPDLPAGGGVAADGWFLIVGDASDDTVIAC